MKITTTNLLLIIIMLICSVNAFSQNTGTLQFINSSNAPTLNYEPNDTLYLKLEDSDQNISSSTIDTVSVIISSLTEIGGEALSLIETDSNTGIFTANMLFDLNIENNGDSLLQVTKGEKITAKYYDTIDANSSIDTISTDAYYNITLLSGDFTTDTTLDLAHSPYLITGDVTINTDKTLTVDPGVEFRFMANSDDQASGEDQNRIEFIIKGTLICSGTSSDSIYWHSEAKTPTVNDWYGIVLSGYSAHIASFTYNNLQDSKYVLDAQWSRSNYDTITIENNTFENINAGFHFYDFRTNFILKNNVIRNLYSYGIDWWSSHDHSILIDSNIFNNINGTAINLGSLSNIHITNNTISNINSGHGIYLHSNNKVYIDNNTIDSISSIGIYLNNTSNTMIANITNNNISNCVDKAIKCRYSVKASINNNTITSNNNGIYIETDQNHQVLDSIINNTITNNKYNGIEINNYGKVVANYNNIYNNNTSNTSNSYDFKNNTSAWAEINTKYNFWGDSTTAQMNLGSNPKNITTIFDKYDDSSKGFVHYGQWLDSLDGQPSSVSETGSLMFIASNDSIVTYYAENDTLIIKIEDIDQNTSNSTIDTISLILYSETETGGETLSLLETGINTGIFKAIMLFDVNSENNGDGLLQVTRGNRIKAIYYDPSDDFNNPDTIRTSVFYNVTLLSGVFPTDTVLDLAHSPYLVTGDITVSNGKSLTIDPGVEIRITAHSDDQASGEDANLIEFIIEGTFISIGTASDSIFWNSSEEFPSVGDWYGLNLKRTFQIPTFKYNKMQYSKYGIFCHFAYTHSNSDTLFIENNKFENIGTTFSAFDFRYNLVFSNNTVNNIGLKGIIWDHSYYNNALIENNIFTNINETAIHLKSIDSISVINNTFNNITAGRGMDLTVAENTYIYNNSIDNVYDEAIYIRAGWGLINSDIIDNNISNGDDIGIYLRGSIDAVIKRNNINNNLGGVYLRTNNETPTLDSIINNTITNNKKNGIEITDQGGVIVNYNNIYNNNTLNSTNYFDFKNNSWNSAEVNAKLNFWGDSTTAHMNTGANPKNISTIYDKYDNASKGFVNYGQWLDSLDGEPSSLNKNGIATFTNTKDSVVINYLYNDTLNIKVEDSDQNITSNTIDTIFVIILSETEVNGETISLIETDTNTGIFTAQMLFDVNSENNGDGLLQVTRGDRIKAIYIDPLNDFGNVDTVEASVIYNVTLLSGIFPTDTILDKAHSPYLLTGDITVSNGNSLTIEPGVEICVAALSDDQASGDDNIRIELIIEGDFICDGTASDSIYWHSNSETPAASDWFGIYLHSGANMTSLSYNSIQHSKYALRAQWVFGNNDTIVIENNLFENTKNGFNFYDFRYNLILRNNTIKNIDSYGFDWQSSHNHDILIDNNIFNNINGTAIYLRSHNDISISNNTISNVLSGNGIYLRDNNILDINNNNIYNIQNNGIRLKEENDTISANILNNRISNSNYDGIYCRGGINTLIKGNLISNNYNGINISTTSDKPALDSIINNTIINNYYNGIELNDYGNIIANYNNIYNNNTSGNSSSYDFKNNTTAWSEIDAKFNFWGDSTTAEINLGNNPKNISTIFDKYDVVSKGIVNYGQWLDSTNCTNTYSIIRESMCGNYSSPSGKIWNTTGIYKDTISNIGGCDSVITIYLNIQDTHTLLEEIACDSYTSPSGSYEWNQSGVYEDTIPNNASCTNYYTVNLTINQSTNSSIDTTVCGSYTSPSGNYIWTTSGNYIDTLANAHNCDSVISIALIVNPILNTTDQAEICQGEQYIFGSQTLTVAGVYTEIFTCITGCDSNVTLTLSVNSLPNISLTLTPNCANDTAYLLSGGTPIGGIYSGIGVDTSGFFNPIQGTQDVTYTYTDSNNCTNSITTSQVVNTLPTIQFSGLNSNYCTNSTSETLVGSPNGGTFSGIGINGNTFSPATAGVGVFDIVYTYTDTNNCTNNDTNTTIIHALPIVSYTGLSYEYCANGSDATLIGSPATGTYSGTGITDSIFSPANAGAGNFDIIYSYTDINNCTNYDTNSTIVHTLPIVSFTTLSSDYCNNSLDDTLTANPIGGLFSGIGITANVFSPSTSGAGNFDIIYSFTDANSCSNSDTASTIVNALPIIQFTSLDTTYCTNGIDDTLTATPTGGIFSGYGITGNVFSPSSTGIGSFDIVYTFTDANLCTNTNTATTFVNTIPSVQLIGLGSVYCENSGDIQLNGLPTGGSFSGAGINGNIFNTMSAGAGNHDVIYSYTDINGCSNTDTSSTLINDIPDIYLGADQSVCINHSITIDAGAGYTSYLWNTGATTQTITLDSLSFNIGNNDYYVEVINDDNCNNADTITLIVDPCTSILTPELSNTDMKIFPNPTKGKFQIELIGLENKSYDLEIYNSLGNKVYRKKVDFYGQDKLSYNVDLSTFSKGIYFIRLQSEGKIKVKKVVIQ